LEDLDKKSEDNIKIGFKEGGAEGVDRINLVQVNNIRLTVVNMIESLWAFAVGGSVMPVFCTWYSCASARVWISLNFCYHI
jgi:hypothetical protein